MNEHNLIEVSCLLVQCVCTIGYLYRSLYGAMLRSVSIDATNFGNVIPNKGQFIALIIKSNLRHSCSTS